jgi:hypothetical protein
MSVPQACQSIQDEIDGVLADLKDLQVELKEAPAAEKRKIRAQIRDDNKQLVTLRNQLAECIASQPNPPPPIEAFFIGSSELTTTNENAQGPFDEDLAFKLNIGGDPAQITIETFPGLGMNFDTPLGSATTWVTLIGGGTGTYDAGKISVPLTLHFATTVQTDAGVDVHDSSDLSLELSTDPPGGSPVTPEPFGNVTLFGSGKFIGGFLDGSTGTLTVKGKIQPFVLVPVPSVLGLFWPEANDDVLAAKLVPEFVAPPGENILPTSWVLHQGPGAGDMIEFGTKVVMNMTNAEQP